MTHQLPKVKKHVSKYVPGDSSRDQTLSPKPWPNFIPDGWRSPFQPLISGHVFTHSPSQKGHKELPGWWTCAKNHRQIRTFSTWPVFCMALRVESGPTCWRFPDICSQRFGGMVSSLDTIFQAFHYHQIVTMVKKGQMKIQANLFNGWMLHDIFGVFFGGVRLCFAIRQVSK